MTYVIHGWVHNPGAHCASTALSDVMSFYGHEMDEPMCFGLGCGLGFAYFQSRNMSPTCMTATRSRMLEPRFFQNMEQHFNWITDPDPEHSLQTAKDHISQNRPLLLRADIAHLHYYNTNTRFPPHVIAMWGFDDKQETAMIADTGWQGLQKIPYRDFKLARYSGNAYIQNKGDHFPVVLDDKLPDITSAARKALLAQAKDLAGLESEMPAVFGFEGMERAYKHMPGWAEARDWKWCARWFYQVIERRGTGGGAFRLLYARFLEELAGLDPAFEKTAPAGEMYEIAGQWTALSEALKEISEQEEPRGFDETSAMLEKIKHREERFFQRVLQELS